MFLGAEHRSKAQVISSNDDQSSLAVYAEHSLALERRSEGFFCVDLQEELKLS